MKKSISLFLLSLFVSACGNVIETERATTVDGIKLISPSINHDSDAQSYWQSSYTIGPDRHLLIRREDLITRKDRLRIDSTHPITLRLTILNATQKAEALTNLKLCPLNKNWMMLATWDQAHPFGPTGKWQQSGGDFSEEACILANEDPENADRLNYNLSDLVQSRLVGMNEAYGWILLSASLDFAIGGEKHGSKFPRIDWSELYVQDCVLCPAK